MVFLLFTCTWLLSGRNHCTVHVMKIFTTYRSLRLSVCFTGSSAVDLLCNGFQFVFKRLLQHNSRQNKHEQGLMSSNNFIKLNYRPRYKVYIDSATDMGGKLAAVPHYGSPAVRLALSSDQAATLIHSRDCCKVFSAEWNPANNANLTVNHYNKFT